MDGDVFLSAANRDGHHVDGFITAGSRELPMFFHLAMGDVDEVVHEGGRQRERPIAAERHTHQSLSAGLPV